MGDRGKQLAEIYDAHAPHLFRWALMILADRGAAEDAVQQAFLKLARMRQRASAIQSIQSYLRVAVRNEAYRLLSARRPAHNLDEVASTLLVPVESQQVDVDEQRAIEMALRSLPADQREVIHLKIYEGMTFNQIAELTETPLNTVASRYRYGIEKLKTLLACLKVDEP